MSLAERLKKRIKKDGAISLADYMASALGDSEDGYYMRKDPLGAQGDFITAPEISQIFGELLGAWIAAQWLAQGKPNCALVELGPGRGTLMADMLRATKTVQGFHDAINIHMVETSPALQQKQWQALVKIHPRIEWHATIDDLPDGPLFIIANEFFDALPIRQYVYQDSIWHERMVTYSGEFGFTLVPCDKPALEIKPEENVIYEINEASHDIVKTLATKIRTFGGAALIVDYGYEGGTRGDTLQAIKSHEYHNALTDPGEADLTAHIDFDALRNTAAKTGALVFGARAQGAFLGTLGAITRAVRLCEQIAPDQQSIVMAGLSRLVSPDEMGDLFKVLCILPPHSPKPEGF